MYKIPTSIHKEAKAYMKCVIATLEERGLMQGVDIAALDMLARNYSTFLTATEQVERDGFVQTNSAGTMYTHPAVKIAKDAQTQAMRIMAEFGLTAKARTKLKGLNEEEDNNDPLDTFLNNEEDDE